MTTIPPYDPAEPIQADGEDRIRVVDDAQRNLRDEPLRAPGPQLPPSNDVWSSGYESGYTASERARETLGYTAGYNRGSMVASRELEDAQRGELLWRLIALGLASLALLVQLIEESGRRRAVTPEQGIRR